MAIYKIQKGDNLTNIVKKIANVSGQGSYGYIQALMQLNNIADPNKIFAGQILNYPDEWSIPLVRAPSKQTIDVTPLIDQGGPALQKAIVLKQPSIWQNPLILGALAIAALLFLTRK